jgi:D-alanyl-D-alanine carboxypeptidase
VGLLVAAGAMLLAGCAGGADVEERAGAATSQPLMPTPSAKALPDTVGVELQQVLERWLAAEGLPGVTAAVATPRGWWAGAAGVDGAGQSLVPESAMSTGSITKTFTAAEVLVLADRGLVDLDAPVTDYVELPFDAAGATVRQVLNMTSGFPTDPPALYAITAAVTADLDRDFAVGDGIVLVDPEAAPMGAPGSRQDYNNLNFLVLGELIERVTDGSYAQAVRSDLLDRADLRRVWVQDDETPTAPLTIGQAPRTCPSSTPTGPGCPPAHRPPSPAPAAASPRTPPPSPAGATCSTAAT